MTRLRIAFPGHTARLAFNWRVIAAAVDESTPIFERLRFVAISGRNLDEFFAKRVGAIKRQYAAGLENLLKKRGANIWTPEVTLNYIAAEVGPAKNWPTFNSGDEGSQCVWMTWRATGLADIARHVIGCHSAQETRVQHAC